MRCFFAEVENWNFETGAVETLRLTDGAGAWKGDDFYEPALQLPDEPIYGRFLFGDGTTAGRSRVEIGSIFILNTDGRFDYLKDRGFDGRQFRLYEGDEDDDPENWTLVLAATQEQALVRFVVEAGASDSKIELRLQDPLAQLDKPLQARKYAGTNSGSVGVEGTAQDIKGLPLPVNVGDSRNVPAHPVNANNRIYRVADGAVNGIPAVYDNAVALIDEGDVDTLPLLQAASITSGRFKTCRAAGLFRLGAEPAGRVTADVYGLTSPLSAGNAIAFSGDGQSAYQNLPNGYAGLGFASNFILSMWVRPDALGVGTTRLFYLGGTTLPPGSAFSSPLYVTLSMGSTGGLSLSLLRNSIQLVQVPGSVALEEGAWNHILISRYSGDDPPILQMFVNDTLAGDDNTSTTSLPFDVPLQMTLGRHWTDFSGDPGYLQGALAEVYFIVPSHTEGIGWDMTVEANRRKFITADGYPADLGDDGALAVGYTPQVYLRGGPIEFPANRGTSGLFSLEGSPSFADTTPYEPPPEGGGDVTTSEAVRTLARYRAGLPDSLINAEDFDAAALARPGVVGFWTDQEIDVGPAIDMVAQSAHLGVWFDRLGVFRCGVFSPPSGAPVFDLVWDPEDGAEIDNVLSIEQLPVRDQGNGLPAASVVVEYGRNYTVQDGDAVAGSVDISRRKWLELEYRPASAGPDLEVKAGHPNAPEMQFTTLLVDADDAQQLADELLALYSRRRQRYMVRTPMTAESLAVDLFDVVRLRMNRFGLDGGLLFRVIGIRANYRRRLLEWDIWGGEYGPIGPVLLGNRTTVFPPRIVQQQFLGVPFLGSRAALLPPRIGSDAHLLATTIGNRATIHPPRITYPQALAVPSLGRRTTVAVPDVIPEQILAAPFLGRRTALLAPAVVPEQFLSVPSLGNRVTMRAPRLNLRLTATFLGNRVTVHPPRASYPQTLGVPSLGKRVALGSPVIQAGVIFLGAPFLGKRTTLHPPAALKQQFITVPSLGNRVTISVPSVIPEQFVAPPYLGKRITFNPPVLVPDQLLSVESLGRRVTIYPPRLRLYIGVPSLGNRVTIGAPTVALGNVRTTVDGSTRTTTDGSVRTLA